MTDDRSPEFQAGAREATRTFTGLIPILSDRDKDMGVQAVMDVLTEFGVVRYDGQRDRLVFKQIEVSAPLLSREIEKRLTK